MTSYPPLRLAVLTGLLALKEDLSVLDAPENPYDTETTEILKKLLAPVVKIETVEKEVQVQAKAGRGRPSKDVKLSEEDQEKLTTGIKELITALDDMGTGEGLATSERIQISKTKANLLAELLKMRERNTAAARVEEFYEIVISILNDYVERKDIDSVLKRLEPYR